MPRAQPRPRRWAAAVAALMALKDEYRAWLDRLPENLTESRTAEKLQAIVDLDLDELLAIEPPRGYGAAIDALDLWSTARSTARWGPGRATAA
jgi:hypothetical protein